MHWISGRNIWRGECPRCGITSFFSVVWSKDFDDGDRLDVLECPGLHPFFIATQTGSNRNNIRFIVPVVGGINIPAWLPDEYGNAFSEMIFDLKSSKYRSAVSIAGIILDAHINSLLINNGDKTKPLAKRLEILAGRNLIDQDQFADGTVARLSRNEVIHPETIALSIEQSEAEEAIDAVVSCLERYYKFRRSKALPAPQVEDTEEVIEEGEIIK